MNKRNKDENIFLDNNEESISMLAEIQIDNNNSLEPFDPKKEIPVLPLRSMVMFPIVVMPVSIGRPSTLKLVHSAYKKKLPIAIMSQISRDVNNPGFNDLYHIGVVGHILRILEIPGGSTTVILQSN